MYKIYKITDLTNGKIYIGQTKGKIQSRFRHHAWNVKGALYNQINEKGVKNFTIEEIDSTMDRLEAYQKESFWILHYNSINPESGYNRGLRSNTFVAFEEGAEKMETKKIYNVEPIRSSTEIKELKDALFELGGERDRFLFTFGINTGLRVSDIIALTVGQIRSKPYTDIFEQKTGKKRRIHLLAIQPDIVEYCTNKGDDEYLFPSKKGGHISTTQAYRILARAGDWIGRSDVGTHTMRKTFGYHYYKKTHDVATLMEIFGHSAPSITKRYIGIRDDEIADSLKDFRL